MSNSIKPSVASVFRLAMLLSHVLTIAVDPVFVVVIVTSSTLAGLAICTSRFLVISESRFAVSTTAVIIHSEYFVYVSEALLNNSQALYIQ